MFIFALSGFLNGILALIFGLFVLLSNRKNKVNQIFSLVSFSVIVWGISYGMWQISTEKETALFWTRFLNIGATLIPIFFLHWILVFLKLEKEKKKILFFGYFLTLFFLLFSFTSFYIKDIRPILNFQWWPQPGIFYHFYLFIEYLGFSSYAFYLLFKFYKKSSGIKKAQIRYVIIGSLIGLGGGLTNFFLWYGILIPPYGTFLVFLYPFIWGYAIIRHRLMDIKVIIRGGMIYTILLAITLSIYGIVVFVLGKFFEQGFGISPYLTGAIVVLIVLFSAEWLKKNVQEYTDKVFFRGRIDFQKAFFDLSKKIISILDLDELLNEIALQISHALKPKFIGFFLFNSEKDLFVLEKIVSFGIDGIHLRKKDVLPCFLKNYQEIFILEEVEKKLNDPRFFPEKEKMIFFKKEMEKRKIAFFAPIIIKKRMIGIIGMGEKVSKDMFSHEEIRFLEIVLGQIAANLENAELYKRVQDFSKELKIKIDQATEELRKANFELQKLDEAKSDFLSIASHQLRGPLTAIKGYLSMLLEGDFGQISQEQKNIFETLFKQANYLIELVQNFLDISRIEAGKMIVEKKPCQIENLIEAQILEFVPKAKEKNLQIEFSRPKELLPKIKIDQEDIEMVLKNLIDNAIHYTEKGKITIVAKKIGQEIEVSVSDTGIGFSQEDLIRLFKKFSRLEEAKKIHVQGSGMGLYLIKEIIEAHQGNVWAESFGQGKGSKFCFRLPLE